MHYGSYVYSLVCKAIIPMTIWCSETFWYKAKQTFDSYTDVL